MIKRENDGTGKRVRRRRKSDRPLSLFPFTPFPTVFSLDICLAFARLCPLLSRTINENPRGVLLEMLAGGVPPGSQNPDLISDKKNVIFRTRFQIWPLKSIPVFRPGSDHKTQHKHWHETEIVSSSATKRFLKIHFEFAYYTFFLIQLEFWNDEHIVNHNRFQTKMSKVCTLFQTKTEQKPYPMGRQMPTSLL